MSQAQITPTVSPSVSLINGRPATTSLDVAKFFGKRHDNVVRSIQDLISNCPEEFTALNFEVSEYTDETGRTLLMYTVYFDGFILLVMGYTGKKALGVKLVYISAFNAMRDKLDALTATELPPAPQSLTPSTPADRAPLRALVHAWATVTGVHHAALWPQVKAHFQLARIDDLPLEWLPDALAFAQGKIDQHRKLHVLPSAPDVPALPRGKRAPGPVERQIMALSVEINEAFGGLRTQLGDVMRRLRNVVRPLYGPTYDALGWHSHAGFSVDSLAGTLSQGHWDSLRHVDDALADARNYAMVFKTLARLHGM